MSPLVERARRGVDEAVAELAAAPCCDVALARLKSAEKVLMNALETEMRAATSEVW
jgi:hypothetical protein